MRESMSMSTNAKGKADVRSMDRVLACVSQYLHPYNSVMEQMYTARLGTAWFEREWLAVVDSVEKLLEISEAYLRVDDTCTLFNIQLGMMKLISGHAYRALQQQQPAQQQHYEQLSQQQFSQAVATYTLWLGADHWATKLAQNCAQGRCGDPSTCGIVCSHFEEVDENEEQAQDEQLRQQLESNPELLAMYLRQMQQYEAEQAAKKDKGKDEE